LKERGRKKGSLISIEEKEREAILRRAGRGGGTGEGRGGENLSTNA